LVRCELEAINLVIVHVLVNDFPSTCFANDLVGRGGLLAEGNEEFGLGIGPTKADWEADFLLVRLSWQGFQDNNFFHVNNFAVG
jgi:hypothetical protein